MNQMPKPVRWLVWTLLALLFVGLNEISGRIYGGMAWSMGFALALCLCAGMVIYWSASIVSRVVYREVRWVLLLVSVLLVLWVVLRALAYGVFQNNPVTLRHMWYGFYVLTIVIPSCSLHILMASEGPNRTIRIPYGALYLVPLVLGGCFLTNDLHELAFRFPLGLAHWKESYTRGPLMMVVMVWVGLTVGGMSLWLLKKCYERKKVKDGLILLLFPGTVAALIGISAVSQNRLLLSPGPYMEIICILELGLFEGCIRIGVIPSNTDYPAVFRAVAVEALIADREETVVYRSAGARVHPPEVLSRAVRQEVMLEEDVFLKASPIRGGHIFWTEDRSAIHRYNRELEKLNQLLEEENDLLAAENELKQERAQTELRIRAYDRLFREIRPHNEKVRALLEGLTADHPEFHTRMARACVINAYIKRRGNLVLMQEESPRISLEELKYPFRESLDYLSLAGVEGECSLDIPWEMSYDQAFAMYDLFEDLAEGGLGTMSAILVLAREASGGHMVRIRLDAPVQAVSDRTDLRIQRLGGRLCLQTDEEGTCAELFLPREGRQGR